MAPTVARNSDGIFFAAMTCLAFAIILTGFAPTFYLKPLFDSPPLEPLVRVHGIAFTLWPMLMVLQVFLIRAGTFRLHRAMGIAGMAIAIVMVVTGYMVIFGKPRPTESMRAFIFTPMLDLVWFSIAVAAGIRFRREAAIHKRLMYFATFFTVGAAMRRLLALLGFSSTAYPYLAFVLVFTALLLPLLTYDARALRRIHPVTLWGVLIVLARIPLHQAIAFTDPWQRFANWLTNS